jgi:hypothetical protein
MNILVFVTDDGTEAGTGPTLFLKDLATSSISRASAWPLAVLEDHSKPSGEFR